MSHYAKYGRRYYQDNWAKMQVYHRSYQQKQRDAGLCASGCGAPLHTGKKNYCIQHATDKGKRYEHGVGFVERIMRYARQSGECAICSKPEPDPLKMHVDHDHKNGHVRGLLCGLCNKGLGHFKDRMDLLVRASQYVSQGIV